MANKKAQPRKAVAKQVDLEESINEVTTLNQLKQQKTGSVLKLQNQLNLIGKSKIDYTI